MLRRVTDIVVAALALVALSPLLVALALAVMLDSPGSPIYFARRAGQYGRPFRLLKFRTMVTNAESLGPAITGPKDRRVTRVGTLLRRAKLDELPQFINLLLGDITLVGPRPEAVDIVERYTERQRVVLQVKPGITGQVQLEESSEAEEIPPGVAADEYYVRHLMGSKIARDLEYVEARTLWTDARIVFDTAALVVRTLVSR
jgi:lipopolysaccharide/colanic/teichoic acid biosynthesis glycosyltransferase